jgi:hypothetical protein
MALVWLLTTLLFFEQDDSAFGTDITLAFYGLGVLYFGQSHSPERCGAVGKSGIRVVEMARGWRERIF